MSKHTAKPWRIGDDLDGAIRIHGGDGPSLATVRYYSDNPRLNRERGEANARLIAAAPDMLEALEACRAWHIAEDKTLGTFHERMELCKYSEWTTRRALATAKGLGFDEKFNGVPRLLILSSQGLDPRIEKITEQQARELVGVISEQAAK